MATSQRSWELNGTTLKYKIDGTVIATISGVSNTIAITEGQITDGSVIADDDEGTIKIFSGALGGKSISISNAKGQSYKLATASDVWEVSIVTEEGSAPQITSNKKAGTATITGRLTDGYVLNTAGTKITYTAATAANKTVTLASITGLKKDSTAAATDQYSEDDVAFDLATGKVTLSENVLTTNDVKMTNSNGGAYTLDFDRNAVTDDTDSDVTNGEKIWAYSGTNATYKTITPAYYSYDETKNTVVYHKQADRTIHAVVKGLVSGLPGTTTEYETDENDKVTAIVLTSDEEDILSLDTATNVITVKGTAITKADESLNASSITFDTKSTESAYTLALDSEIVDEVAPELVDDTTAWSLSGSATKTAKLTGTMDAGFTEASDNKSITYTGKKTGVTLATISGLSKDTTLSSDKKHIGTGKNDSFASGDVIGTDEEGNPSIALSANVLGETNVVLTSDKGYTLAAGSDVLDEDEAKEEARKSDNFVWSFDKTTGTATYSQFTPTYFTESGNNSLICTVGTETKTLATVTGLNKNLILSDDRKSLGLNVKVDGVTTFVPYVTVSDGVITLSADDEGNVPALAGEDIVVSGTGYTLNESTQDLFPEPAESLKFSVSGTTATLRKGTAEGYTLSDNKKAFEYSAEDTGSIVATVTGLKSGLKESDLEYEDVEVDGNTKRIYYNHVGVTATQFNEETNKNEDYITEGLTIGEVTNHKKSGKELVEISGAQPALLLTEDVLAAGNVAVSGTGGYQLDVDTNKDTEADTSADGTLSPNGGYSVAWKVSGNTAILVPYSAEAWTEKTETKTIKDSDGKNASAVDAVYNILYSAAAKGETLATIKGLNSKALTVKANGQIDGIDTSGVEPIVDSETGKVTGYSGDIVLSKNVLNKTDVSIDIEGDDDEDDEPALKLKLNTDSESDGCVTETSKKNPGTWAPSGTNNKYVYTEVIEGTGYAEADDGSIVYMKAGTDTATVTNVTAAPTFEDGVIKVSLDSIAGNSKGVPQNVTLTLSKKYNKDYKLAIADDDVDDAITTTYGWSKAANATKATYNQYTQGFTLAANGMSITYTSADKPTVLATISGLKKTTVYDVTDKNEETGAVNSSKLVFLTKDTDGNEVEIEGATISTDENGDQIITLDKAMLGQNNVTLAKNDNYSLAINATDCAPDSLSPFIEKNKGTVTVKEGTSEGWTLTAPKTITYNKANLKTLATVSGLATDAELPASAFDPVSHVITLGYDELNGGGSKVTLKDGTSSAYTLALNQTNDVVPTAYTTPQWTFSNGKATLQDGTSAGWTLTNSKTITKQAAKLTNVATITGLPKNLVAIDGKLYIANTDDKGKIIYDETTDDETGVTTKTPNLKSETPVLTFTPATYNSSGTLATVGTITVSKELLAEGADTLVKASGGSEAVKGVKKLALGAKDDYVFKFDTEDTPDIPAQDGDITPTATANGTVEYKISTSDGYALADKTITYTAAVTDKTIAKVTGLSTEAASKTGGVSDEYITLDSDKKTITLTAEAFAKKKVTLTSDEYTLSIDESLNPQPLKEPKWTVKGTTATLKEGTSEGYTLVTGGKSITYSAETSDDTVAVITGIAKGKKAVDGKIDGITVYSAWKTIALDSTALGTTDVKLNAESEYSFDLEDLKAPRYDDPQWTVSNGTATLKQNITDGFTATDNNKTLKYTAAKTGSVMATITGLNTAYDYASNSSAIEFDESNNRIILGADALGNKKISIKEKNSPYSLELSDTDNIPLAAETVTEWVTSGTTATYKNYTKAYYNKNLTTGAIEYNAESKPIHTYVTISGLAKDAKISSSDVKDKVITLKASQVDKSNITLKDGEDKGYTLKLAGSVDQTEHADEEWTNKNGTATLKGTLTKGFTLAANGKSATYLKTAKTGQTFATVTNLKTEANIADCVDEDGVITLTEDELNGKNVKLTNSNGSTYTLKLGKDVEASKVVSNFEGESALAEDITPTWSGTTTRTLKGLVSAGYKLTDANNITYTKATATKTSKDKEGNTVVTATPQTLLTIAGVASGATLDEVTVDTKTINLKGSQLTSKVTVTGTGYHDFAFASDYTNSSIVGSAAADTISVDGTNLTISLGKGNDYLELNNHGNTFVYANGEGDDVIADFTIGTDKIKLTSGTVSSVEEDGNDIVVKVGKGSITLKDKAGAASVMIYDKNNAVTSYTVSSADLLDSDNFITADSQLGSLADISECQLGDFNATQALTDTSNLTQLTKQSSLVTFGNDKK